MANVSFRASNQAGSSSANTITVTEPTGTAINDWMIAYVGCNGSVTLSDNNGSTPFTKTYTKVHANASHTIAIFVRKNVSGDPTSWTFDSTATDRISVIIASFQDGDSTTAYDVTPDTGTGNASGSNNDIIVCTDITTVAANAIHIICGEADASSRVFSNYPTGYTLIESRGGTGQPIVMLYKVIATASATGSKTVTLNNGSSWLSQSFAIKNGGAVVGDFIQSIAGYGGIAGKGGTAGAFGGIAG